MLVRGHGGACTGFAADLHEVAISHDLVINTLS